MGILDQVRQAIHRTFVRKGINNVYFLFGGFPGQIPLHLKAATEVCEAHLHQDKNLLSLKQFYHKPIAVYSGGLLKGTTTIHYHRFVMELLQ